MGILIAEERSTGAVQDASRQALSNLRPNGREAWDATADSVVQLYRAAKIDSIYPHLVRAVFSWRITRENDLIQRGCEDQLRRTIRHKILWHS